jgi:hypothetical protein
MNRKDLGSGAFFMAVGLLYGGVAIGTLPMGAALNMGPGYFPIVLSCILFVLGFAIAARGFMHRDREFSPFGTVPWRGIVMLTLATLTFAFCLQPFGLFLTVALSTWLAALAKPGVNALRTGLVSLCIAIFCTTVFTYAIGINVPAFGELFAR